MAGNKKAVNFVRSEIFKTVLKLAELIQNS
jgi:hypothetical protein